MSAPLAEPENVAATIKALVAEQRMDEARQRYAEVVSRHQRRASRIALHYLRDAADADEAVQDAFVKAFTHIGSYKDEWPFEVWFTRILINGCLDRLKARRRRERWIVPMIESGGGERELTEIMPARGPSPEDTMLLNERRRRLAGALAGLPERQRTIFMLSHYEGHSSKEVSAMTGLNESTVRVHLFRAIRKLRGMLAPGENEKTQDLKTEAEDTRNAIR
ncbi:MAG TPA: sigma-70 family RNA polymerase sigma factor [Vicinamibacterales bacterium]|nr:sigma-70 family RNA polymerase sigma factor [Vicinamibacterales bacterium]